MWQEFDFHDVSVLIGETILFNSQFNIILYYPANNKNNKLFNILRAWCITLPISLPQAVVLTVFDYYDAGNFSLKSIEKVFTRVFTNRS